MNPGQALFRGILEAPDEDAPRLVYADWLQENGQEERAVFIREQIAAAHADPAIEPPLPQLEWADHFPTWAVAGLRYHRGFICELRLSARDFIDHASELFELAPIQRVEFEDARGRVAQLVRSPHLGRLHYIELSANQLNDADAYQLSQSANLGQVRELVLGDNRIRNEGLYDLARSQALPHLECLHLWRNRISFAGIRALATSPVMHQLELLYMAENELGVEGTTALAHSEGAGRLRVLDLRANDVGTQGVHALFQSPHLSELRELYLGVNDLRNDLFDGLHNACLRLDFLELWRNELRDEAIGALMLLPCIRSLTGLDLSLNNIGSRSGQSILESKYIDSLARLDVGRCHFAEPMISALRARFGDGLIV